MTEAADTRNPREFYIIDTRTPNTIGYIGEDKNLGRNWAEFDLAANPEYKAMLGMRGEKLKKANAESGVELAYRGRPENFHDMNHLTEEVTIYKTEDGFVWIPKEKPEDAKRIMRSLRKLDAKVSWHPMGAFMTEEELKVGALPAPVVQAATLAKPMGK